MLTDELTIIQDRTVEAERALALKAKQDKWATQYKLVRELGFNDPESEILARLDSYDGRTDYSVI